MKKINSIIMILFGLLLSSSIVSCGNDDDNTKTVDMNNPQLGTWVFEKSQHDDSSYDERTIIKFTFTKSGTFSMFGESYVTVYNEKNAQYFYGIDTSGNLVQFPIGKEVHYVWMSETGEYIWNQESNEAAIYGVSVGSRASESYWSIKFKFSPDFMRAYVTFNRARSDWEGWYDRK